MSTRPRIIAHLTRDQACLKIISLIGTPVLNQPDTPQRNVTAWLGYADGKYGMLSTGEKFMVDAVRAVWNGGTAAPLAGLRDIDRGLRISLMDILYDVWGAN